MTQVVSKAVGIDLGTTNSAVALMDPSDTDIIIHRDPRSKSQTTPSCVWRDPGSGELVVGRKAFMRVGGRPEPIRSIKRMMGQRTTVSASGREMSPEEVSAAILAEMKRQIEEDTAGLATPDTSWLVDRAIITVPAYFDQPQIEATHTAAEMAGLRPLDLLHEPTAAAGYHCWRTGTRDGTFLVYDLGGGTFDVSVVRCVAGVYEVLGISGNNMLGGDDIDSALARRLQEILCDEGWALDLDLAGDPADRERFTHLRILAEGAKKALSGSSEYILRDTGRLTDKEGNSVSIEAMIERSDLDDVARPLIERTLPYCHEALERAEQQAGIGLGDVDQVILAGGTTHMPLVRELVERELCADARCDAPLYEKVDTVVALGAAVRASVVGGLEVYDPARTVRVAFRGASATGSESTYIGGTVTALADDVDLTGGQVVLTTPDGDSDESDLSASGGFRFQNVPLEPGTETALGFEIFDADGVPLAEVGRVITHSEPAAGRLPRPDNVAVAGKPVLLEVKRSGRTQRKELVSALEPLPTSQEFHFTHPGGTERVLFRLYQQSKLIKEIHAAVPSSLPRGTPISLDLHMDHTYLITVRGTVGDHEFAAEVQAPEERSMPSEEDVTKLRARFDEAVAYLPTGVRNTATVRWQMAYDAFETARREGDTAAAVHEFEELEEIVARLESHKTVLEPPKFEFDELVEQCLEVNRLLAQAGAEAGVPHDAEEMSRSIEAQRAAGERSYQAGDQRAYGDTVRQLTAYLQHLYGLVKNLLPNAEPTDTERAQALTDLAAKDAERVGRLAAGVGRADIRARVEEIQDELRRLQGRISNDPRTVQTRAAALRVELGQPMGQLQDRSDDFKLPEDHG